MNKEQLIKIWKENEIIRAEVDFYCGGDDFGDLDFRFLPDIDDLSNENYQELVEYLTEEIYENVDFYESSDGYYMGEYGSVTVELVGDDFEYTKESTEQYSEEIESELEIDLDEDEVHFINKFVDKISGSKYEAVEIEIKDSLELDEKSSMTMDSLVRKIEYETSNFFPNDIPNDCVYDDYNDHYNFDEFHIMDDVLFIIIQSLVIREQESES